MMINEIRGVVRAYTHIHRPDGHPNVFLFSTPRSGSTWLMELIWTQPGFKFCNEPLDIRNPLVAQHLRIQTWQELYDPAATAALERYFSAICNGTLRFKDPPPFKGYYRPITHRIVFKEIHAGQDRIDWFTKTFNGRAVYLIRHPVAVSLSRQSYPTLDVLLSGNYSQHFSQEQLAFAHEVVRSGTKLEQGVLAWCLHNFVPLKHASADWAVVTYEQLILQPRSVIDYLSKKLDLPHPERMVRRLNVPSASERLSDSATRSFLHRHSSERAWLIDRWREHVPQAEERRAMDILAHFELDAYASGTSLPAASLWVH
jgi:hypothetical protein